MYRTILVLLFRADFPVQTPVEKIPVDSLVEYMVYNTQAEDDLIEEVKKVVREEQITFIAPILLTLFPKLNSLMNS
jgi:hypothetical protein